MISCQYSVASTQFWQLTTGYWQLGYGAVAQLGERLVCNQEATGSIPVSSTNQSGVPGPEYRVKPIQCWVSDGCWHRTLGWRNFRNRAKVLSKYFLK
jgi:hypothetical protein